MFRPPLIFVAAARWRQSQPLRLLAGLGLCLVASGCGGGGDPSVTAAGSASAQVATPATAPATAAADVAVLMMGNSHTVVASLPARLQAVLQVGLPGRSVLVVASPSNGFLDDHLRDPQTLALLSARRWQAVVLQAQKYSSTGQFNYSTAEAKELVRLSRGRGAVPVLFPEWARRNVDEVDRIWALHSGIAASEPACVAPVPQAWASALAAQPALPLHHSDGNHAADTGAQLTAMVLAATITGLSPLTLADVPGGGDAILQQRLREAAAAAMAMHGARASCPADPLVR